MNKVKGSGVMSCLLLLLFCHPVYAGDVLQMKNIGMDLARDLANEAVMACRKAGYQVSAVVVDRSGSVRAALRDDLAARFTLQIAEDKANAVTLSGVDSGTFLKSRGDIRPELNHITGIVMLEGALPVSAGGYRIGAIGVSGAPGGDLDADCAKKAIAKMEERLEFAD